MPAASGLQRIAGRAISVKLHPQEVLAARLGTQYAYSKRSEIDSNVRIHFRTSYCKSLPCARVWHRDYGDIRHRLIVTYLPLYLPSGDSKDEHHWWSYLFIDLRAVATHVYVSCRAHSVLDQCARAEGWYTPLIEGQGPTVSDPKEY